MPPSRRREPRSLALAALGQAVEQAIDERALSQSAFAQLADLDVRQVSALVRGQANPTYDSLLQLCRALGIPLSELVRRVEALLRTAGARPDASDAEAWPW